MPLLLQRSRREYQFIIFRKIFNWRFYTDERLNLSLDEAQLWQLEIDQLQRYLTGKDYMGWEVQTKWEEYWRTTGLLYGSIEETLQKALAVCQASIITGNPIEFFW